MERRLIVMRHAKSSWKNESLRDHERPLNKRGRRDAPRIGEELASLGWVPQRVISSDATRDQLFRPYFMTAALRISSSEFFQTLPLMKARTMVGVYLLAVHNNNN